MPPFAKLSLFSCSKTPTEGRRLGIFIGIFYHFSMYTIGDIPYGGYGVFQLKILIFHSTRTGCDREHARWRVVDFGMDSERASSDGIVQVL